MNTTPTLTEWQLVPSRIAEVLPHAAAVKLAHEQAALKAGILAISAATWSPELNAITLYSAEQFDKRAYDIYEKEIYDGERCLASVSYNAVQPDWNEEILVKRGSLVPGLPTVWNAGNKMLELFVRVVCISASRTPVIGTVIATGAEPFTAGDETAVSIAERAVGPTSPYCN